MQLPVRCIHSAHSTWSMLENNSNSMRMRECSMLLLCVNATTTKSLLFSRVSMMMLGIHSFICMQQCWIKEALDEEFTHPSLWEGILVTWGLMCWHLGGFPTESLRLWKSDNIHTLCSTKTGCIYPCINRFSRSFLWYILFDVQLSAHARFHVKSVLVHLNGFQW